MNQIASAWDTVRRYPVLLWLPVGLSLWWVLPMSLWIPGAGYPVVSAGISFMMLVGAFVAPAVAGGYNAMVGAAATGGVPSMQSFREGWGKYYGRIVGAFVLMALIVSLLSFRSVMGGYLNPATPAQPSHGLLGLLSVVLSAFTHVWLAALVINDQGILDTTAAAGRSVARRFADYLPFLGISLAAVYLIPSVARPDSLSLSPVMAVLALLSSVIKSAVQAFVRVGAFTVLVGSTARTSSPPYA